MTADFPKTNHQPGEGYTGSGVSIVVLNRNGAAHLKNFFESFYTYNSNESYELIVVDHASTDNSLGILRDYERKLKIRVIKENTNKSFSYSNNNAVNLSGYENLLFVNNDIVLRKDVIPGVLNHLKNPGVGVVGIELYYPGEGMGYGPIQHSGIRFREDLRYRFFRPCNLKSSRAVEIEHVPAVTGAFLACRKSDFRKAGGFCESYFYGYEDVDLCLSIAKYTKKKCVIDRKLFAIHDESATQRKDARRSVKQRRLHNIGTLISRYGYGLKRACRRDMYKKDQFWTDTRPVIGFVVGQGLPQAESSDGFTARKLAESLEQESGFECRLMPEKTGTSDWYDASGLDVLAVSASAYDLTKLKNPKPSLIKAALVSGLPEEWIRKSWFGCYDVYLCPADQAVFSVLEKAGCEAHELKGFPVYNSSLESGQGVLCGRSVPGSESMTLAEAARLEGGRKFARILENYRNKKYRIAIKIAVRSYKGINKWADYRYASEMGRQFKKLGHSVRIDIFPEWYRNESFGDDVVIVLRGFRRYRPSASHINLLWHASHHKRAALEEYANYDHVFVSSEVWANRPNGSLAVPVSVLLEDIEYSDYGPIYNGLVGYLKAGLAAVKSIVKSGKRTSGGLDELAHKNAFMRQAMEFLKIIDECNARKSIN